jgi:AraC-like DNA-binding protein
MPGPVQEIALEAAPGAWLFWRADPAPDLAGLVVEYWEVRGELKSFRETLLPNGCVELMLNLGPPHRILSDQAPGVWDRGWLSGLHDRSLIIESLTGTHLLSARLHPLEAVELLGPAVAGIANSVVDLETFLGPDGRELRKQALEAGSPGERFAILERYLGRRRSADNVVPHHVRSGARLIELAHGNLRISTLHEELRVSRKHLSVSFTRYLGVSAKVYAQIQRFVWTLARLRESTEVDWPKLASDAGYSDQSHLARDFRRVGAASPTEYLRRWSPDGTALLEDAG